MGMGKKEGKKGKEKGEKGKERKEENGLHFFFHLLLSFNRDLNGFFFSSENWVHLNLLFFRKKKF